LIVIGSRGDSRIGRALVGGVAQKVMGLSEYPVLVLHF
jgi:nucleotide-binding universal stress UspA family protein